MITLKAKAWPEVKSLAISSLLLALLVQPSLSEPARSTLSDKEAFARARNRVMESLKDPGSAKFGSFFRSDDSVCGSVNAKNGFGGYTGMSPFVYSIGKDNVLIAPHPLDDSALPAKLCSKP